MPGAGGRRVPEWEELARMRMPASAVELGKADLLRRDGSSGMRPYWPFRARRRNAAQCQ